MKSAERVSDLISIQWPRLEKRARGERNLKRLIAVFEQMENLLFNVEMISATRNANTHSEADSRSACLDPEIKTQ